MNSATTIKQVMTAFPHSIGYDQNIKLAKEFMRKHNIRHLPVQRGGQLMGILTDRDVNLALALDQKYEDKLSVEDVCIPEPYVVEPTVSLKEVVKRMSADKLGCALVVEQDRLVGIYTTVDACRDLAGQLN